MCGYASIFWTLLNSTGFCLWPSLTAPISRLPLCPARSLSYWRQNEISENSTLHHFLLCKSPLSSWPFSARLAQTSKIYCLCKTPGVQPILWLIRLSYCLQCGHSIWILVLGLTAPLLIQPIGKATERRWIDVDKVPGSCLQPGLALVHCSHLGSKLRDERLPISLYFSLFLSPIFLSPHNSQNSVFQINK